MFYELTDRFRVPADIERTWAFFSAADNLGGITPPWLAFTVRRAPGRMEQDARLDYTIRWLGVPVRWQTRIIDWSPPRQFIDLQIRGPYTLWHHQHQFTPLDQGVECFDRVIYRLPLGWIGRLTHAAVVRRQLMGIFRHRREQIGRNLGGFVPLQANVLIRRL